MRLLGPVDVTVDGAVRPVSGLRRKAVLAVLALQPGQVVSTDRLIDVIWAGAAPATAANALQSHVSYLRRVLGTRSGIVARPPGYLLNLNPEATDVALAERIVRDAQPAGDADRARLLRAALDLWRGRALADVVGLPWLDEQALRLDQLWLRVRKELAEASLALGERGPLVADLEQLVRDHPLDEQLTGLLMLALYRSGRQADALAAYRRLRDTLAGDLGIDPSQRLRDLEAAILRQDPALAATGPTATGPTGPTGPTATGPVPAEVVPAQLPPVAPAFAGRDRELARLDKVLAGLGEPGTRPGAVAILALSGTAGVGKTTLAVHWAHRVADRFPDGQLYVNLRGFDRSGSVMDPADAMRGFLDALDVPPQRVPVGLEAQAALYRSLLTERRMLVVLDNARDAEHVRPLLPGAPGCLVVVTSRDRLSSLVSAEGAVPLTLDLLTDDGSRELLARRTGEDRLAAEPDAVDQIVARCVGLPLALAIVAARAATYPQFKLQVLADELGERRDRLDALAAGDPATEVRAVFSWSYRTVSPVAARMFRLLGLHVGPDISAAAAASLAGVAPRQARALLDELARANLLVEHTPARYTFHDLLRAYAVELAHRTDGATQRRAAVDRVLDHYLYTGHAAALLLNTQREPILFSPLRHGVTPEQPADHARALDWFTAEHPILLAAVQEAARTGYDTVTWQLAWMLTTFLNRRGHWREWAATWRTALAAAHRLADEYAAASAHRGLSWAYLQLGRYDDAFTELHEALRLYDKVGHLIGQADTYLDLSRTRALRNRNADAIHHARQALELYRAAGHRAGQALALNNIGMSQTELGDHREALVSCEQALALQQEYGNADGVAGAWDSLGSVHHHLGDHARALDCYRHALDLYVELGDRFEEAATMANIGDVHQAVGERGAARDAWRRALGILDDLAHPDADRLRDKLRR